MGEYNIHKFKLTDTQLNKIKNALENNKSISLTIKNNNFFGSHPLPITSTEKEKIDEGFDNVQVKLSKKKLQFIKDQERHNKEVERGLAPKYNLKEGSALRCNSNKATLGVGKCSHCGGILKLKV